MTHHPDIQDVREKGLMIHIHSKACGRVPGYTKMCTWSSLEKGCSFSLLSSSCCDGVLSCQKMSQHKQTLYDFLCVEICITFQNVCELNWHKLIITSEMKKEQLSFCLSMSCFSDRYLNIWKGEKNLFIYFLASWQILLGTSLGLLYQIIIVLV